MRVTDIYQKDIARLANGRRGLWNFKHIGIGDAAIYQRNPFKALQAWVIERMDWDKRYHVITANHAPDKPYMVIRLASESQCLAFDKLGEKNKEDLIRWAVTGEDICAALDKIAQGETVNYKAITW